MKTIVLSLFLCLGILSAQHATAQVNVNVNIGVQPVWGPVGYDYVEYYYFPDIEVYYYVPTAQYVYFSGGRWVFVRSLPSRYSSFNVYSGYKVVINEPKAYLHFDKHKVEYVKFKGNKGQAIIKNSNDSKYYIVKGHPNYKKAAPAPKATGSNKAAPAPKASGNNKAAPAPKASNNKGGNVKSSPPSSGPSKSKAAPKGGGGGNKGGGGGKGKGH